MIYIANEFNTGSRIGNEILPYVAPVVGALIDPEINSALPPAPQTPLTYEYMPVVIQTTPVVSVYAPVVFDNTP